MWPTQDPTDPDPTLLIVLRVLSKLSLAAVVIYYLALNLFTNG